MSPGRVSLGEMVAAVTGIGEGCGWASEEVQEVDWSLVKHRILVIAPFSSFAEVALSSPFSFFKLGVFLKSLMEWLQSCLWNRIDQSGPKVVPTKVIWRAEEASGQVPFLLQHHQGHAPSYTQCNHLTVISHDPSMSPKLLYREHGGKKETSCCYTVPVSSSMRHGHVFCFVWLCESRLPCESWTWTWYFLGSLHTKSVLGWTLSRLCTQWAPGKSETVELSNSIPPKPLGWTVTQHWMEVGHRILPSNKKEESVVIWDSIQVT